MQDIIIDPEFRDLIPSPSKEELAGLESSIVAEGCRDSLMVWEETGILLDGHNRHEICERVGKTYTLRSMSFGSRDQAIEWVIRNQFSRRNLSAYDRAVLALKLKPIEEARAKEKQVQGGKDKVRQISTEAVLTSNILAKEAGVSSDTIKKVTIIEAKATPEVKAKLSAGTMTINSAWLDIKQQEVREEHRAKVEEFKASPVVSNGPYDLILADPPWRYDFAGTESDAIENKYATATLEEIKSHKPDGKDNSILLLWATAPKLVEAMEVMTAWGYTYKTHCVWDKETIGMGYWFRGQHELLLVGVRGHMSPPPDIARVSSVFREAKTVHSKKPVCVYEWIEQAFPGLSKLEMYCRSPRVGWSVWGNEVQQ